MAYPPTAFGRSRRPSQKLDAGGMRVGSRGSLAAQLGIAACVALGGAAAFVVLDSETGPDQPPTALSAAPEPAPVVAPPAAPSKSARTLPAKPPPTKVAAIPEPPPPPPPMPVSEPPTVAPNLQSVPAAPELAPPPDRNVFAQSFAGADPASERLSAAAPIPKMSAPVEAAQPAPAPVPPPVAMAARTEPVQTNSVAIERVAPPAPTPAPAAPPGVKYGNAGGGTPTDCLPKVLTAALSEVGARFGGVTLVSTTRLNSRNHAPGSARAKMHEACMAVDFKVSGSTTPVVAYLKGRGGLGGIEAYRDGVIHMDAPAVAKAASGAAGRRAAAAHDEEGESMDASDHRPIAVPPAPAAPAPARPPPVMNDR